MTPETTQLAQAATEVAQKSSLLGTFGIDWKIFVAQLINFGIVVFVLWKWVYKPLIKIIEERRVKIEKGLQDAEFSAKEKAKTSEEYQTTLAAARREAQKIIEQAEKDAAKVREEGKAKTQAEIAKVVADGKLMLADEKEKIVREARKEIAELSAVVAEKALGASLKDAEQKSLIKEAVKRLAAEV